VESDTVRVRSLAQEHNTIPWPGLKPELLDLEVSALTMSPIYGAPPTYGKEEGDTK